MAHFNEFAFRLGFSDSKHKFRREEDAVWFSNYLKLVKNKPNRVVKVCKQETVVS